MKTLRDVVNEYRSKVASPNELPPGLASKILTELSALLGNVTDRILETEMIYNKKLLACYDSEAKANRAKIVAETTDEYRNLQEAKNMEKVMMEMIRSLKYYLRAMEDGYEASTNT